MDEQIPPGQIQAHKKEAWRLESRTGNLRGIQGNYLNSQGTD